jgi:hypothetical protein
VTLRGHNSLQTDTNRSTLVPSPRWRKAHKHWRSASINQPMQRAARCLIDSFTAVTRFHIPSGTPANSEPCGVEAILPTTFHNHHACPSGWMLSGCNVPRLRRGSDPARTSKSSCSLNDSAVCARPSDHRINVYWTHLDKCHGSKLYSVPSSYRPKLLTHLVIHRFTFP